MEMRVVANGGVRAFMRGFHGVFVDSHGAFMIDGGFFMVLSSWRCTRIQALDAFIMVLS